jgi:nitrite reductase (cytochrome c-552)
MWQSAQAAGVSEERMAEARRHQRSAQFLLDFIEAENSTGFHAGQEAARILTQSIDYSRKGQLALREPLKAQPAGQSETRGASGQ